MFITNLIAKELNVATNKVQAALDLFLEGCTVPFVARYRKEVTGGLDDTQLRTIEERNKYLTELEERKLVILRSVEEQGKLTEELKQEIEQSDNKARLEDLYLPYKPKRVTRGQKAIEAGLEPLADLLYKDPNLNPEQLAEKYLNPDKNITTIKEALDGAKYILMERFSMDANLLAKLRNLLWETGFITSKVVEDKKEKAKKFTDYFEYQEKINTIPAHRVLAILRGRNEGFLQINIETEEQIEPIVANYFNICVQNRPADKWLSEVVKWTWQIKLKVQIDVDLITKMREKAEISAVKVFADNLRDLLMAAPAGAKVTMGLDPGLRTGVKVAIVDKTGKFVHHDTIYPHAPHQKWNESLDLLSKLCAEYNVELISIGNGTASRETDDLVKELCLKYNNKIKLTPVIVSESGASVYSASEFASKEFPDLDVSIRGAVSIARRLQDPLAELVKIDPKAIGVGLYQHDVSNKLTEVLDNTVEDCVNVVGVDVNIASAPLLARVSGLNQTIATNIVAFRDKNGSFTNRDQLKQVSRLGDKAFQQSAGFLRILNGDNPLDKSGVHPEAYPVVDKIITKTKMDLNSIMQNSSLLKSLSAEDFIDDNFGLPTVIDLFKELEKPGRDPRPEFKTAKFKEGVNTINDLKEGMILEGTVTNVANFGAFVDIGVHQDGLVHISQLSNTFVKDPRDILKTGEIVTVKVVGLDLARKRVNLSMLLNAVENNKPKNMDKNLVQDHKIIDKSKNKRINHKVAKTTKPTTTGFGGALFKALSKE